MEIGFKVHEYIGAAVIKPGNEEILTRIDDLVVGDEILAFGSYYKVVEINGNRGLAENLHIRAILDFDKDSRHCWVASGLINLRGISKFEKANINEKI